jgi:putative glutamine transport system substrate-binding protein
MYFEHEPFSYKKDGKLTGIEVDILAYFAQWVKENKGVDLNLNYIEHEGFQPLYEAVKKAPINTIGAGTITISKERKTELNLTAPYLRNVSVLVSHGSIPTARTAEQFKYMLNGYYATTIKGSLHEQHLKSLWKKYDIAPKSEIEFVGSPIAVVKQVAESGKYYGYTDLITFWRYIKQNDQYVKMHKEANVADEYFAFAFPQRADWFILFNEFMESGFGFTSTKDYHKILEKHLSYEVIEFVELE